MSAHNTVIETFKDLPELTDFAHTAHWLALRGWSEAAGGNMSVRLDLSVSAKDATRHKLPLHVPHIAGQALLLTGSGTRARETSRSPKTDISLIKISDDGHHYHWLAGHKNPTSELAAHCAIHNTLARTRPEDKAVMHTHPAKIIALCHVESLQNGRAVSDKILGLQSEAFLHIPEGIGYVSHQIPGSLELGLLSASQVEHHRLVLWHMHGCLATGPDLASAYDLMDVFEKCASLYWTLRAAGIDPDGMSEMDIQKTLENFGLWQRYKDRL